MVFSFQLGMGSVTAVMGNVPIMFTVNSVFCASGGVHAVMIRFI
jgi:hypothetical protein